MAPLYSSAAKVIAATGITPATLKLASDDELAALIEDWLDDFAAVINADRNRNVAEDVEGGFLPADCKRLADLAAFEMACQQVRNTIVTITSPVVRVDEIGVQRVGDTHLFTGSVKREVRAIPKKRRFSLFAVSTDDEDSA